MNKNLSKGAGKDLKLEKTDYGLVQFWVKDEKRKREMTSGQMPMHVFYPNFFFRGQPHPCPVASLLPYLNEKKDDFDGNWTVHFPSSPMPIILRNGQKMIIEITAGK